MTDKNTSKSDFVKALQEVKNAPFNKINPHFKSKYADYGSVKETTDTALHANNLALFERAVIDGEGFYICSEILHTSGDIVASSMYPLTKGKPQDMGSQVTYAKRYNRCLLLGIYADADDDGEQAEKQANKPAKITSKLKAQLHDAMLYLNKAKTGTEFKSLYAEYKPNIDEIREKFPVELTDNEDGNEGFDSMFKRKVAEFTPKKEEEDCPFDLPTTPNE